MVDYNISSNEVHRQTTYLIVLMYSCSCVPWITRHMRITITLQVWLTTNTQSRAVIARSTFTWYWTHHCRNWSKLSIIVCTHQRHPMPRPDGRALGTFLGQSVGMCLNTHMIFSALNLRELYLVWINNWTISEHSLRNYHYTYSRPLLNQYWPMVARYAVIWDTNKSGCDEIDTFCFRFMKSVLGVKSSTSTIAVYGELGFFPEVWLRTQECYVIIKYYCTCHPINWPDEPSRVKCRCIIKDLTHG